MTWDQNQDYRILCSVQFWGLKNCGGEQKNVPTCKVLSNHDVFLALVCFYPSLKTCLFPCLVRQPDLLVTAITLSAPYYPLVCISPLKFPASNCQRFGYKIIKLDKIHESQYVLMEGLSSLQNKVHQLQCMFFNKDFSYIIDLSCLLTS